MATDRVGESIRELRDERGWKQRELAERLGVSPFTVSRWERGDSTPSLARLNEIADTFGVTLTDLIEGPV